MDLLKTATKPCNLAAGTVLLAMSALLPGYVWHEGTSGFLTDDGTHLMLADFFSPWHQGNIFVDHLVASEARFPPIFPMLIGLLGGGSQDMAIAHLVTAASLCLSALLLFVWGHRTLGASLATLACLLIYVLLPESLIYVLELRSEFLYIALVLAAFLLLQASTQAGSRGREILAAAALVVALCFLTRTIGIVLFAASLFYLYHRKAGLKFLALYIAVFSVLPLAWYAIKAINGYTGNYVEDLHGYLALDGLGKLLLSDVPRNAGLLVEGWQRNLAIEPRLGSPLQAASIALLGLAVVGAVQRARRGSVDFFYTLLYIPPLLVWPHPFHIERLLYPLVPVLMVYVFLGTGTLASWLSRRFTTPAHAGLAIAVLALILAPAAAVYQRFMTPLPEYLPEDFRHTRVWLKTVNPNRARSTLDAHVSVIRLLKRSKYHLEENDCMQAVHPVSAMLYANRPVVMVSENPSPENLARCKYLFVMNLVGEFRANYPLEEVDPDILELIDTERDSQGDPQAFLFRIKR